MQFEGTLAKWNDERGFGFIAPRQGGAEIFVHISSFPNAEQRPQVGESLWFEIELNGEGKKRAVRVIRPRRHTVTPPVRTPVNDRGAGRGGFGHSLIALVLLVMLCAYGYRVYLRQGSLAKTAPLVESRDGANMSDERAVPVREPEPKPNSAAKQVASPLSHTQQFTCDGRTRCSQMTSCAEATYFLAHCPGVEMDNHGHGNGIPCEQQWCTSGTEQ
jgi:cold shock CspA family protein